MMKLNRIFLMINLVFCLIYPSECKVKFTCKDLMLAIGEEDVKKVDEITSGEPKLVNCEFPSTSNALDRVLTKRPLTFAARLGFNDIVLLLLKNGAEIDFVDEDGTALHHAIYYDRDKTVELLLKNGARADIPYKSFKNSLDLAKDKKKEEFSSVFYPNLDKIIALLEKYSKSH